MTSESMPCSEVNEKLSGLLDGELPKEESLRLRQHIESCQSCATDWDQLRAVDEQLSQLAAPEGMADRIAAQLAVEESTPNSQSVSTNSESVWSSRAGRGKSRFAWGMIAAIAASVTLVVMLDPREKDPGGERPIVVGEAVAANIVRTDGDVQVLISGSQQWGSVASDRTALPRGSRVRTALNSLAELETSDRGRIRLNENAELVVYQSDQVEILRGELWCEASADVSIEIKTPVGWNVEGGPSEFWTMTCPKAGEVQLAVDENLAECVAIGKLPTQFQLGVFTCPVSPGETVKVDADRKVQRSDRIAADAKVWQFPLLADEDRGDAVKELSAWLRPMLTQIGQTKVSHMHERQIRALGPAGAIPLIAYVISDESRSDARSRHTAIRLGSELADERAASQLIQLIEDDDQYVAERAKAALERLERRGRTN